MSPPPAPPLPRVPLFSPRANTIVRTAILAVAIGVPALLLATWAWWRSPTVTGVDIAVNQPVQFSHEHHVAGLGIDCRYCHTSVETSAFAGIPPTETCMSCHWQIWTETDYLAPIRASWNTDTPVRWNRVNNLADFVYFNHAVHVNAGVGCVECHGRVDRAQLLAKAVPLHMKWCLDCHRHPEPRLRPPDQVFNMEWPARSTELRAPGVRPEPVKTIQLTGLTNCSACHR